MFGDLTRVAAKQLGSDNQLQTKPVSQTSGQFQHMSVTYFAVHVLKCTDTYVQAHITFFVIMVILWNGCIFLYIALTMLLVYLNWVNLLCRSVWPHCPYMVQCNTVYSFNALRPEQNGWHNAGGFNKNCLLSLISQKLFRWAELSVSFSFRQTWCQTGDKLLPEPSVT